MQISIHESRIQHVIYENGYHNLYRALYYFRSDLKLDHTSGNLPKCYHIDFDVITAHNVR